ncbi:hypothetical protein [Lacrimispora sp.]|jgi:hypothetical protein|uniref:hypothetical protein n=1 Tax=Lacrimispora sp. TaxID=2719234 RepID=UPI0028AF1C39|nr:hypothetical protein [Lacrimispora sp.]
MATKKLYTVFDNGKSIGEYSSMEAAALLNLPCATISAYASSGAKALERYTFEVCSELEFCTDPLYVEWDKVRNEILTAGR